jgi:hypothetical protein
MTEKELLSKIIKLPVFSDDWCKSIGNEMFILESQNGFPACFFIDELKRLFPLITKQQLFSIICHYQIKNNIHKCLSGIGDKRLKKIQENNKKTLIRFWENEHLDM